MCLFDVTAGHPVKITGSVRTWWYCASVCIDLSFPGFCGILLCGFLAVGFELVQPYAFYHLVCLCGACHRDMRAGSR